MNNPNVLARVFCHQRRLPWDHVGALVELLDSHQQSTSMDAFVAARGREFTDGEKAFYQGMNAANELSRQAFERCQSPIEDLFLAFLAADIPCGDDFVCDAILWHETDDLGLLGVRDSVIIYQQFPIGRYRADFALVSTARKLVVELDGHDFHERTKDQASRDKKRDRVIQEQGWAVFRFTGSEVWSDPAKCVAQCLSFMNEERVA